jgi:hypothetical protein
MPLTDEIRDELEKMRGRLMELLISLEPRGEANRGRDPFRTSLWQAVRSLDPLLSEARLPKDLDLTKDDSTTQQLLYAFVAREQFSARPLDDEGDIYVPQHTPEQCNVRVFFQYGRWFVTWTKLEEDMDRPEALTQELLRFERNDRTGRLVLTEV